jgi:hypothetical protein
VRTAEAENAFNQIKSNPDFGLPFTVQTASSDRAIRAVLKHVHDGVEKVISYRQNENVWQSYLRFVIFGVTSRV